MDTYCICIRIGGIVKGDVIMFARAQQAQDEEKKRKLFAANRPFLS